METWDLAVVAALVLGFAVVSRRLETTVLTAPIVFVIGGLIAGNEALGWIDLHVGSGAVRVLAEVTLTLVLFADAARIDLGSLRREVAFPARLLGIGLPLTLAAGALVAVGVLDELLVVEAVVLAVVLAPTDAALGQAVVTDPRLPSRIRQGLNVESGLNDGLCVPLLFIALAIAEADVEPVSAHDAVHLVSRRSAGASSEASSPVSRAQVALRFATRHGLVRRGLGREVVPIASRRPGLRPGGAARRQRLHRGVRAARLAFGALRRGADGEVTLSAPTTSGQVLSALTFVVFGAVVLGPALAVVGWEGGALRRSQPDGRPHRSRWRWPWPGSGARAPTVAYTGWFGPRGLASIVFAVIVIEEADPAAHRPHDRRRSPSRWASPCWRTASRRDRSPTPTRRGTSRPEAAADGRRPGLGAAMAATFGSTAAGDPPDRASAGPCRERR